MPDYDFYEELCRISHWGCDKNLLILIMFKNVWSFLFRSQMIWYLDYRNSLLMILQLFMVWLESIDFIHWLVCLIPEKKVKFLCWRLLFIGFKSAIIIFFLLSLKVSDVCYSLNLLILIRSEHSLRWSCLYFIRIRYQIFDQSYSIENRCPIPLIIIIANTQLYPIVLLIIVLPSLGNGWVTTSCRVEWLICIDIWLDKENKAVKNQLLEKLRCLSPASTREMRLSRWEIFASLDLARACALKGCEDLPLELSLSNFTHRESDLNFVLLRAVVLLSDRTLFLL